jgi:diguanylate cyclase
MEWIMANEEPTPPILNVLVVEDSPADARLLKEAIKDSGSEAQIRLTFEETLARAEARLAEAGDGFDCVLLDLGLPDAQGIENVQRIRAINRFQTVVVMTGLESEEAALGTIQRGAQDYVLKGRYNGHVLMRILRRAIERNRVLSEIDRRAEEQYHLATHDGLTGLPNRKLFEDRAQSTLAHAQRQGEHFAIGYMDLNGFKPINDLHGHAVGDSLLRQVGLALREAVRAGDTVARVGGDEFLFLLAPVHDRAEVDAVVRRLLERIRGIREVDGREVSISASVGLAFFPEHGTSLDRLIGHADQCMYDIKRETRAARGAAPRGPDVPKH